MALSPRKSSDSPLIPEKILIVEDNEVNRMTQVQQVQTALKTVLGSEAELPKITTCNNGEEAIQYLREHTAIAIMVITDLEMPEKDGFDVLACCRSIQIPSGWLALWTTLAEESLRQEMVKRGLPSDLLDWVTLLSKPAPQEIVREFLARVFQSTTQEPS